ncbi:MAG: PAS domain S-box protein [Methanomicrobiaceae archaeon]|nr:PAS domain S-box protein [Methanomicrobiaceae archaeon]
MAFVFDFISFINLIFCAGIVLISIWWYRKTDSGTPLIIGSAFLLFGISHISLIFGLKELFEPVLVVVRIIAYILVFAGFFFIAREVMDRRKAEEETRRKHDDLNRAYEQLAADEEELKQNFDELQKAEEELKKSEERFRALYDENPSMYFTLDEEGKILSVNEFGASQLGYTAGELAGGPVLNLFYPDDRAAVEKNLRQCLENKGIINSWKFRKVRKDGTVIWVGEAVRAMRRADGSSFVLVVCRDITEQMMAQAALERANEKINLLNKVTFNDIQNAVFSLYGYIELQNQLTKDGNIQKYIEKEISIIKNVNESLEFARRYQNLGLKPALWQNVEQVFLFAISHIDFTASHISHRTDLRGVEIFADPSLEDVFFALADNSVIHGEHVTVVSLSFREGPDSLTIVYKDDGRGIPAGKKDSIFEKYQDEKIQGIGLFLSREILSITGIEITEKGREGEGVNFEIRVPKGGYRFNDENH